MTFLLVLLLAAQAFALTAFADDEALLEALPGQWIFSAYTEEQEAGEETPEADLAILTLNRDGSLSLLCRDKEGGYLCTCEGVWSSELVRDGMDRLTLRFTSSDLPAHAGAYSAECTYNIYSEGWVENDIHHTYLILEEDGSGGTSPYVELYGEDAAWSLALHREQAPNMRVVRCSSYVSLRESRSKSSAQLAKVPLGAQVLAFPENGNENGFLWCVYHDTYGYILKEYLQPIE